MMFKIFVLFAVGAAALDAPVITLDLEVQATFLNKAYDTKFGNSHTQIPHHFGAINGQIAAKFHVCPAGGITSSKNCPIPSARAYDHHDGDLEVTKQIFLTNDEGKGTMQLKSSINYKRRSEYLLQYSAEDKSGNKAESAFFVLVLNDLIKPVLTVRNYGTVESCVDGQWKNAPPASSVDNIDGQVKYTVSPTRFDTTVLGKRKFSYISNDNAGIFGLNGLDNVAHKTVISTIVDTKKPVFEDITTATLECNKPKPIPYPRCKDQRDNCNGGDFKAQILHDKVDRSRAGKYQIHYTCFDKAGHYETTLRDVHVKDTIKPVLTYFGNHKIEHSAGTTMDHENYLAKHTCRDACCGNLDQFVKIDWETTGCDHGIKSTHGTKAFHSLKPGTYYQKFSCTDCNDNINVQCRTIINQDKKLPVLTLKGTDVLTLTAAHGKEYIDQGATCSDQVDGMITSDKCSGGNCLQISGDVPNFGQPGTYHVKFNCKDTAGNKADELTRKVIVSDVECPTCTINGPTTVTREASFTYNDAGAVCTDDISLGNNKMETRDPVDSEKVGTYVVTYRIRDAVGHWNDGDCQKSKKYTRTVHIVDTLKPVIALHYKGKVFHKGGANDHGANGQSNPARKHFMAETSSVNGWVVGAIASAVAGVALLATSSKRAAVSVPV